MSQTQRHTMEKRMVVGREGGVLMETPLTFKHLNSSSYVRNTIKSGKWSFLSMAFPKTLCLKLGGFKGILQSNSVHYFTENF